MLMIFGWLLVCLFSSPSLQQQCDKCFCPSSRAIPRSRLSTNDDNLLSVDEPGIHGLIANRKIDIDKIDIKKKYLEFKRNIKGKMKGLDLNEKEKSAILSMLDNAKYIAQIEQEERIQYPSIAGLVAWKTVYKVLYPKREIIKKKIFPLADDDCTFMEAIKCTVKTGGVIFGCSLKRFLTSLFKCSNDYILETNRICGKCVCTAVGYFLNKARTGHEKELAFC